MRVGLVDKARTLCPKRLVLSLATNNPLWWAIYKSILI